MAYRLYRFYLSYLEQHPYICYNMNTLILQFALEVGKMEWMNTVFTDGSRYFVSNPLPKKGETISLWIRIGEWSPVKQIILRTKLNGVEVLLPMEWDYSREGLAYFKTSVTLWEDVFHYHFYLITEDSVYYYTQNGFTQSVPDETYDFRILTDYQQPEWVKHAVFYQIFPDRFCSGDEKLKVKDGEYQVDGYPAIQVKDWRLPPSGYWDSHCLDFYGGDLEGIIRKIPYLKKLGVNALYINPIFRAPSVHRYDCIDYFTVDPHLGGNSALARLSYALHLNDMKLVLDISINHTGSSHVWFNKDAQFFPAEKGAYLNPDAKEREYYFFEEDNTYRAWDNVETLPALNYTSQSLREILYQGEDSVIKKWLKPPYEIDGWRFDVADIMARNNELQLHHEVWPQIRRSIKETNKDAYLLAEDWCDCAEFLTGREWDSPMNYFGCARPVREFAGEQDALLLRHDYFKGIKSRQSAEIFAERICAHFNKLPTMIAQNQFNLLDSHDISRLHNNPEISRGAWKNAVLLQFALPGCVSIYYGDEAGIDGRIQDVEGCRYPMPWDKDFQKDEPYRLYYHLIQLRKKSLAFTEGSFKILYASGKQFACARFTDKERYLVACSMEKEDRDIYFSTAGLGWASYAQGLNLWGEPVRADIRDGWIHLFLPAESGCVMQLKTK